MPIKLKRVYDAAGPEDGYRVLVDRIWPRGVRKQDAGLDEWMRDVAPSSALCKWFGHDPAKWDEFRRRYAAELETRPEPAELAEKAKRGTVTLLFAARDVEHNNAVALKETLESSRRRGGR